MEFLSAMLLVATAAQSPQLRVDHLRTEYLERPLAIDTLEPRFSWEPVSDKRDAVQTSYRILVSKTRDALSRDRGDLWDSGRVADDATIQIVYRGQPLKAFDRAFWKVRVWDGEGQASEWSAPAEFGVGPVVQSDWGGAVWISRPGPDPAGLDALPVTYLRTEFQPRARVRRATLFATALGAYKPYLNGRPVGNHDLAPEWTDYHRRVQYQAYDVTRQVQSGTNALGAMVGDGWYAGRIGMAQEFDRLKRPRAVYGRVARFLALLRLELADGTVQTIATHPDWRASIQGPVRSSDILDGEVYDARKTLGDWSRAGYDDFPWTHVGVRPIDPNGPKLVAQRNEPIRVVATVTPIAINEPKPGVYVVDMGQNMVGRIRVRLAGTAGQTIQLRHGEMTNDDGTLYTANLRGAPQVHRYTPATNRAETFEPTFTYQGFRFLEITGVRSKPTLQEITGLVSNSSSPEVGTFETSNPLLNKLWENVLWTQRANMQSTPTDCPQRDERLGWMGDILAFRQAACFNMDMAAFYSKWLGDVRDAQADDGRMPDFAPNPFDSNRMFSGVPAWGDAGVFVPWAAYVNYGDRRILEESFESARRWVDWVASQNPNGLWLNRRHNDYNDWLNGDTLVKEGWPREGATVPREVFATMFFAKSTEKVARMAKVLGREDEAARYRARYDQIVAAFQREFVTPQGKIRGDTQAGYALALAFRMMPEGLEDEALAHLKSALAKYQGRPSTGFLSTNPMMLELAARGELPTAYRLAQSTEFPSWGYSIEQGATTIWERWDGYVKGRGFQDPGMNSFNHWAFGSVTEWMVRVIGGIAPNDDGSAYSRFVIAPQPGGGLTHAKVAYRSIRGPIRSEWRIKNGRLTVEIEVPANTRATVRIPSSDPAAVREASGLSLAVRDGWAQAEVGGGKYRFEAPFSSR